jgi:hypothetical protein
MLGSKLVTASLPLHLIDALSYALKQNERQKLKTLACTLLILATISKLKAENNIIKKPFLKFQLQSKTKQKNT